MCVKTGSLHLPFMLGFETCLHLKVWVRKHTVIIERKAKTYTKMLRDLFLLAKPKHANLFV